MNQTELICSWCLNKCDFKKARGGWLVFCTKDKCDYRVKYTNREFGEMIREFNEKRPI